MDLLARSIDQTLLNPLATQTQIRQLVAEAVRHRFASVCVNGKWITLVAELLRDAGVMDVADGPVVPCAVVGFPLGAMKTTAKALEAIGAMKDGAREIDMVADLGAIIEGDFDAVRADIFEVVKAARAVRPDAVIKVILETAALTQEQTALGCQAARQAGADFVKTSTGFHARGGATEEAVGWLVRYGQGLKVKASGGIKDRATALRMLAAGAQRIGTSSGGALLEAHS